LKYPAALNGPQFLARSILQEPFKVVNGEISVPRAPGLGVEVAESELSGRQEN
jgi:L-alanine-DL-glutamate epimerase-like enolase superfamily enzyme